MPKLLRDFQCLSCERTYERFISTEVGEIMCECGEFAYRVVGMPTINLDGTDAGFPGAYDKWARIRESNAREKSKRSYAEP